MIYAAERETEKVQEQRSQYREQMVRQAVGKLKFLDESGSNIAMTRLWGRAAGAKEFSIVCRKTTVKTFQCSAGVSLSGVSAPMTIDGAVDGLVFLEACQTGFSSLHCKKAMW